MGWPPSQELLPAPADIEIEPGLSLIAKDPENLDDQEFLIWNGEAVIGSLALVLKGQRAAQPAILLNEKLNTNGTLENLSRYAFEEAGYDSLLVTVGGEDRVLLDDLETAGFRLATISNANNTFGLELYADKTKTRFPPIRVDLDELTD